MEPRSEPTRRTEIGPATPASLHLERDGTGSASFGGSEVLDAIVDQLVSGIEHSLARNVRLLGVRFVDGDGRDAAGPVPGGVVLIGFAEPTTEEAAR